MENHSSSMSATSDARSNEQYEADTQTIMTLILQKLAQMSYSVSER